MGIRTGSEFLESLRDERVVYVNGERLTDVTTYPPFQGILATLASLACAAALVPAALSHAAERAIDKEVVVAAPIQTVWQTNPVSRTIMVITFISTLLIPLQFAVLLGVVISILLFVFQQSNTIKLVEWDVQESGWPVERPAPKQLQSNGFFEDFFIHYHYIISKMFLL